MVRAPYRASREMMMRRGIVLAMILGGGLLAWAWGRGSKWDYTVQTQPVPYSQVRQAMDGAFNEAWLGFRARPNERGVYEVSVTIRETGA